MTGKGSAEIVRLSTWQWLTLIGVGVFYSVIAVVYVEARASDQSQRITDHHARIAVIESNGLHTAQSLRRIESQLDRLGRH
jgi:hypothetical protein